MHFQISQVYQFAQHDGKFLTTHQSVLHTLLVSLILFVVNVYIGGFRGGAEGGTAPLFFLYLQHVLRFCFEYHFIKSF